jgi:hypothetical protein
MVFVISSRSVNANEALGSWTRHLAEALTVLHDKDVVRKT